MARHGAGGGTASIMAVVGNNVPCANRSATTAFFPRMEVFVRQQGGGFGDKGNKDGGNDGGGDVYELAVTRAGVGRHNESGRGEAWTR